MLRLGVLIPCRNEALVIERKLLNIALGRFPAARQSHRIVVVDDGSDDGTAERARACADALAAAGLELSVIANAVRPGKPGAIRQGLAELGGDFDLVVLTDADVVVDPPAWNELAQAFADDPRLALACGAQRFVRDLAADGTCRGADGTALADASSAYDRWTARVRALESRSGRLFSVHGQLLAWRAQLGLAPSLGLAADDLDLMLQVRSRECEPRHVRCIASGRFYEVKTPAGRAAADQALRRARAYFQVLRSSATPTGFVDRSQWSFYRWVPEFAPELAMVAVLSLCGVAWSAWGGSGAVVAAALLGLCLFTPPGRRWRALMRVIRAARTLESRVSLPDRWEMVRR